MNPRSSFEKRGERVKFADYYEKQYSLKISDMDQPLLVSNPKKKDERAGQTGPILLIPELCNLSGLTEEARSDFSLMKDIAIYTRIPPAQRQETLIQFMKDILR